MEYDKHEKIIRGMKRDSFLQKPTSSLITIITQFYPVDMNAQICLSHTQKENLLYAENFIKIHFNF